MKLDKLHVLQYGAGTKGHRHTISCRVRRVGCTGIDLACAARRQYHGSCRKDKTSARMLVQHECSATSAVFDDQIHRKMIVHTLDALLLHCFSDQDPHHFVASRIATSPENATAAVRGFSGKGKFSTGLVEFGAPSDQLLDPLRSFFDEHTHCILATETMAGLERVGQMDRHIVFFTHRDGDAALCVNRTALERVSFREDQHPAIAAEFEGCAQTGHSTANDEEVSWRNKWRRAAKHTLSFWFSGGLTRQGLAPVRTERNIALHSLQEDSLRSHPLQARMASVANAGVLRILFPQSLPMDVDIDVIIVNHDPFDSELHRDVVKRLEITFSFPLQSIGRFRRDHERRQPGRIFLYVGLSKRLHRFVNAKIPFMILGILDSFRAASKPRNPQHNHHRTEKTQKRFQHARSIGTVEETGQDDSSQSDVNRRSESLLLLAISTENF